MGYPDPDDVAFIRARGIQSIGDMRKYIELLEAHDAGDAQLTTTRCPGCGHYFDVDVRTGEAGPLASPPPSQRTPYDDPRQREG